VSWLPAVGGDILPNPSFVSTEAVPLRHHLSVLRASSWLIVLSVVVAMIVALVVSLQLPRTYESRATLYVGQTLDDPGLDYSGLLASQILAQTYAELASTRPVLQAVIAELDLEVTAEDLKNTVSTEVPLEGTLLEIAVRDGDPEAAADIANAIAGQLLEKGPREDPSVVDDFQRRLGEIDATIGRLQAELSALLELPTRTDAEDERLGVVEERLVTSNQARATMLEGMSQGSPNALTLVEDAVASDIPVAPSRTMIVALAVAASLAGSILIAYVLDAMRRSAPVADEEAVEHSLEPAVSTSGTEPVKGART
jgi:succinoglycan biosynthesis transport protein ExoP